MLRRDLSRKPKIQSQIQIPGETPRQAKNKQHHKKLGVIWIGAPLIGTATDLGLAYGMSECTAGSGPGCKFTSPHFLLNKKKNSHHTIPSSECFSLNETQKNRIETAGRTCARRMSACRTS